MLFLFKEVVSLGVGELESGDGVVDILPESLVEVTNEHVQEDANDDSASWNNDTHRAIVDGGWHFVFLFEC